MIAPMRKAAQLIIRTALPELTRLAEWVEGIARDAQLAADTTFALHLCLEEAVANIVMHGGAQPETPICVELGWRDGEVVATIEDQARAFDPTALPSRIAPKSLDEARIGELGVHLIRSFASRMQYERRDGRNRLDLHFALPLAAAMPA